METSIRVKRILEVSGSDFTLKDVEKFFTALKSRTNTKFTLIDVAKWLAYCDSKKVDKAILEIINEETLQVYKSLARTLDAIYYRLQIGPKLAGGVDVSKNYPKN